MATTTSGFRYPVSADDPDIPRDIRQLAEDIDNYLNATGSGAFNGVLPVIDINGNSTTATRLATSRTISLGGNLSGSASFDGSANITISATVDPLSGTVPTGAMTQYLGTTAPSGWLFCIGQNVSRSTYSGLFSLFGTRYGAGDGSTTFAIPDMRERFARGSALTGTLSGTAGGSATHQHTNTGLSTDSAGGHNHEVDVPSLSLSGDGGHTHTAPAHTHSGPSHTHALTAHDHAGPSHAHSHNHATNPSAFNATSDSDSHSHTDTSGTPSGTTTGISSGVSLTAASTSHTHSISTTSDSHAHVTSIDVPSTNSDTDATLGGTASTGNGVFDGASPAGGADNTAFDITEASGTANTGSDGGSATDSTTHAHTVNHPAFNTTGGEGAHTHGQGTSDSISNIPPYIDVNYIVKI